MNLRDISLVLQKLRNWPSLHEANNYAAAFLDKLPNGFCSSPDRCDLVAALLKIAIAETPQDVQAAVDEGLQTKFALESPCYGHQRWMIRFLRRRLIEKHD